MITKDSFMNDFDGHGNAYSTYMVIGVSLKDLIGALNEINPDMCVGSGKIDKRHRAITFEICKESPDLIYDITKKLNCQGYADEGAWYGTAYFMAAKNGKDFNDFKAEWRDGSPDRRDWENPDYDYDAEFSNPDEDMLWDAFVLITDHQTGAKFYTGDGAIPYEDVDMWSELVNKHRK